MAKKIVVEIEADLCTIKVLGKRNKVLLKKRGIRESDNCVAWDQNTKQEAAFEKKFQDLYFELDSFFAFDLMQELHCLRD